MLPLLCSGVLVPRPTLRGTVLSSKTLLLLLKKGDSRIEVRVSAVEVLGEVVASSEVPRATVGLMSPLRVPLSSESDDGLEGLVSCGDTPLLGRKLPRSV